MKEERHWKWLSAKIPQWVEKQILTAEQANRLLEEAPDAHAGMSILPRILIAISALLFGLGVISFFAFNWQSMPKGLKIATVFTAFIAAHGAGILYGRIPGRQVVSEFLHLLGTLLFGAGIILVAQIYHINDHFPNGVLLWSAGALLMAYVLDSTPQMIIYTILIVVWQAMERSYDLPRTWALGYAAAGMLPYVFRKKHWFSISITSAALLITLAIQLSYYSIGLNGSLFILGALNLGIAVLLRRKHTTVSSTPLEIIGTALYLGMLISLTFTGGVKAGLIKGWSSPEIQSLYVPGAVLGMTLVVWAVAVSPIKTLVKQCRDSEQWPDYLAFPGLIIAASIWLLAHGFTMSGSRSELAALGTILFIVMALIHGLALIFTGTRTGRVGLSFIGCLLVVTVIISRFMAYSDDLLVRSVVFMLGGVFILIMAMKTARIKKGRVANAKV